MQFDPTTPPFYSSPEYHDVLRWLRDEQPVHEVRPHLWTVARWEDIREVSRDNTRFISGDGVMIEDAIDSPTRTKIETILFMDPPLHSLHRKIVNRRFTPLAVGSMEESLRRMVVQVMDRFTTGDQVDVVDQLTAPVPINAIAELIGVDESDRADFRHWSDASIESPHNPEETMAARIAMYEFVMAHIERTRAHPGDDVVSQLVQAEVNGEPLTEMQIFAWLVSLIVAGNETTRTLLSCSLRVLAEHPDQRALLVADPSLIPNAVEELLRWVTPIQTFCRKVVTDTTVGGQAIPGGDWVLMLYGSGNRDPRAFGETADRFDVTRPVNPAHLSFGFGEHLCLGAALARLEARIFFEEFLARWPNYEVRAVGEQVASTLVCGLKRLDLTLAA